MQVKKCIHVIKNNGINKYVALRHLISNCGIEIAWVWNKAWSARHENIGMHYKNIFPFKVANNNLTLKAELL